MRIICVGEARIEIRSSGCVDCGRQHSDEWHEAGAAGLAVAGVQREPIQLWRCDECHKRTQGAKWPQGVWVANSPLIYSIKAE